MTDTSAAGAMNLVSPSDRAPAIFAAFDAKDVSALAAHMTDDVRLCLGNAETVEGKTASLHDVTRRADRGDRIAIATVVGAEHSALRPLGTKMAINDRGEISGTLETDWPARLMRSGSRSPSIARCERVADSRRRTTRWSGWEAASCDRRG
jgi:XdhC and CoxI family